MGSPVYAVDVLSWPRCDAEASPGRGYLYHLSRHSAGQPIVAGWAYQLVARLGFERDSWPEENPNRVAAEQVSALVVRLPQIPRHSPAPLPTCEAPDRSLSGFIKQFL